MTAELDEGGAVAPAVVLPTARVPEGDAGGVVAVVEMVLVVGGTTWVVTLPVTVLRSIVVGRSEAGGLSESEGGG